MPPPPLPRGVVSSAEEELARGEDGAVKGKGACEGSGRGCAKEEGERRVKAGEEGAEELAEVEAIG